MATTMGEALFFLRSWINDPLRVAAIAPSGEVLARLITQEIDPRNGPVLELGPGTGAFTRALIERGVAESDLVLIELDQHFADRLRVGFPSATILERDAARLGWGDLPGAVPAGAAVSGLPLLSMSSRQVMRILASVFAVMRPDAAFYQFTYGARCPVPLAILGRLDLVAEGMGGTLRNLPPASVYRIRRRGPAASLH